MLVMEMHPWSRSQSQAYNQLFLHVDPGVAGGNLALLKVVVLFCVFVFRP